MAAARGDSGPVAVIGEETLVRGFALAGATVLPAGDPAAVRRAWQLLPGEVKLVILTRDAEAALAGVDRDDRLLVVVP